MFSNKAYSAYFAYSASMALYHKHRPQTFASVVEQAPIMTTLENQLRRSTLGHAYLFSGPRGVGKTTTARVLAKAVNCERREAEAVEPCNECRSCTEISAGIAMDVVEIDAASHTGVDNVRQNIIESAQFQPSSSKYKIFIIDEVHMLSTAAFNALLKTLEEPPKHVLFILATTETHKIPATILSRCQRFTFKKVAAEKMIEHLASLAKSENVEIDAAVLKRIAKKSDGCVRDAISLLEQVFSLECRPITAEGVALLLPMTPLELPLQFVQHILKNETAAALGLIRGLINDGLDLIEFGNDTLNLVRVLLIVKVDAGAAESELDVDSATLTEIQQLAGGVTTGTLVTLADKTLARVRELGQALIPQLPLELLAVDFSSGAASTSETPPAAPRVSVVTAPAPTAAKPVTAPVAPVIASTPASVPSPIPTSDPTPAPVTPNPNPNANLNTIEPTRTAVEAVWPQFLTKVEVEFPSLIFLLKMAHILTIDGTRITLGVQYSFHAEKLSQVQARHNIENILSGLLGQTVQVTTVVTEGGSTATAPSADLQNLANAFGGQVIS